MLRRSTTLLALSVLLSSCASSAGPPPEGAATPATGSVGSDPRDGATAISAVDRLLELSEVESIVSGRAPEFTRRVALMAGDLTDAELERLVPAVQAGFAPARLREDVLTFIASEADEGTAERILALLQGGANAELNRVTDGYEPELTLDEYVRTLVEGSVPEDRVRLVVEWARVQGAGDFFVLLDQALAEASHTVLRELRPDTPPFRPLAGQALAEQLEASSNAAVVTFLYRLEPVSDDLLRRATEDYGGADGQWYAETYSLAVARAMRAASQRVVADLRQSRGPG